MKFFKLLFVFLLFPIVSNSQEKHVMETSDKASTHGMLIFGKNKIYAYHLPMFHSPHNYQIILELELAETAKSLFIEDQKNNPEYATYTIEPETFVLPQMIAKGNSFMVDLYRGHFERGGKKIASKIKVAIKEVLFYNKFKSDERRSALSSFILFGNEKEQFMAHLLTNKPDFDQIIEVKAPIETILKEKNNVVINTDLIENSVLGVNGNEIEISINKVKYPIVLLRQLYLEFGDLK
ncbi:hypothetical protein [uncultured Flavobacterium sp.]|uniref:hypothetical protein n=1 Tax=uncultured Flavobacterium sp. TaxID=165435 RepID=UPI00308121BE